MLSFMKRWTRGRVRYAVTRNWLHCRRRLYAAVMWLVSRLCADMDRHISRLCADMNRLVGWSAHNAAGWRSRRVIGCVAYRCNGERLRGNRSRRQCKRS